MVGNKLTQLMTFNKPQKEVYLYVSKKNIRQLVIVLSNLQKKCIKMLKNRKNPLQKMFFAFSRFTLFQTRDPFFSVPASAIFLIFFLFERACQDAELDRVAFLNKAFF